MPMAQHVLTQLALILVIVLGQDIADQTALQVNLLILFCKKLTRENMSNGFRW